MAPEHGWSIQVARFGGVTVRVHLFFWILASSTLAAAIWSERSFPNQSDAVPLAVLSLGVLGVSLVLHEFGHWWAARHLGGEMPTWTIGPISGMGSISPPAEPGRALLVHLAGPAVHLLLASIGLVLLGLSRLPGVTWLHPMYHESWSEGLRFALIPLTLAINGLLFVLNISPSLIFDGGRALRAGLLWKWPGMTVPRAELWVVAATRIVAAALLLAVFLAWQWGWLFGVLVVPFALFALFLFFSSESSESRSVAEPRWAARPGYDSAVEATLRHIQQLAPAPPTRRGPSPAIPSADDLDDSLKSLFEMSGADADAPHHPSSLSACDSARGTEDEQEADEEQRMDELLIRVHEQGIHSLDPEEFAFLQKVSARYRARRQHVS
jgi:Zn-dependent protease